MRETPIRVTDPEYTWSAADARRLALAEALAPNAPSTAALRFRRSNATAERMCACGAPGTVRVRSPHGGHVGAVPPEWWRCESHWDVPLTVPWDDYGQPEIGQSRQECSWRSIAAGSAVYTDCGCGTHIGELAAGTTDLDHIAHLDFPVEFDPTADIDPEDIS